VCVYRLAFENNAISISTLIWEKEDDDDCLAYFLHPTSVVLRETIPSAHGGVWRTKKRERENLCS
jgi:hypothetical protein